MFDPTVVLMRLYDFVLWVAVLMFALVYGGRFLVDWLNERKGKP